MKKFLLLCVFLLVFGVAGIASAIPTTWVDEIDFDDFLLNSFNDTYSYYHDIGDNGFVGFLEGGNDIVTSYNLRVRLYDDQDREKEKAVIFQLGLFDNDTSTTYNFSWDFADIGWTLFGLADINSDGTLNVWIKREKGDFFVDWSTLTAYGDNGDSSAPVPEPATMLLLGSGLVGLAGFGRKKFFKKG